MFGFFAAKRGLWEAPAWLGTPASFGNLKTLPLTLMTLRGSCT